MFVNVKLHQHEKGGEASRDPRAVDDEEDLDEHRTGREVAV